MLNRIKRILEFINKEQYELGKITGYSIVMFKEDHLPPHIHIIKNNEKYTKIQIPKELPVDIEDLVYPQDKDRVNPELDYRSANEIINWFKSSNSQDTEGFSGDTNLEMCQNAWDELHPELKGDWN